jgi:hypothetical protein
MAISRPKPDILIRSPEGYPIAVVEVKNRQNLSRDVATELRRNMVVHGLLPRVPYFLLTSQDVGFLWKGAKEENLDAPPTYEFPMEKVVARYLKREPEHRLYGAVLELLVLQWLNDLTRGAHKTTEEPEKTLALAGFNESIRGATVVPEDEI